MKLLTRIGCAAAAALCLLVAGCGDEPLAKYVPEGANLVVGVDGVKLKAHPLTDKIIQMVSQDADGRKLEQEMAKVGLKPSDFEAEYLGFGEFSAEVQKGGVVIRTTDGRAGRIFEALKKEGAAAEFGGKPGLKMPGEPETHIVLVDSDLLMFNVDGDWEFPFKAEGKNKFALSQQFDKSLVLAAVDPSTVVATMPQVPPFAKKLQSVTFSVQEKGDKALVTALACQFSDADAARRAIFAADFVSPETVLGAFVNNAATAYDDIITNMNADKLRAMFEVNTFAPMILAKYAIRNMILHGTRGAIVHISSVSVHTGYKGLAMYAASKGALEAFSKNTAREWGVRGIRSNAVAAGFMQTDMSASLTEEQRAKIYARTSLKSATSTESVAKTVAYLLSDGAAAITGQTINADNGTI